MSFRTDRNNNPAAFTVDIARQAGLIEGSDFIKGDPFPAPSTLITAKLIGDPIKLTIKVIDAIGFYNKIGQQRWVYIGIPRFVWTGLSFEIKKQIIAFMYSHEDGIEMKALFI